MHTEKTAMRFALVREAKPWFDELRSRHYSEFTIAANTAALISVARHLPSIVKYRQITAQHLDDWLNSLKLKYRHSSIVRRCESIKTYFDWLERRGAILINPAHDLTIKSQPRPLLPAPTEAQILRCIACDAQ